MIEAKCNDDEEGSTMTSVTEPTHRDKKGVEYDYGSWLASGACRMELFALLLGTNEDEDVCWTVLLFRLPSVLFTPLSIFISKSYFSPPYLNSCINTRLDPSFLILHFNLLGLQVL